MPTGTRSTWSDRAGCAGLAATVDAVSRWSAATRGTTGARGLTPRGSGSGGGPSRTADGADICCRTGLVAGQRDYEIAGMLSGSRAGGTASLVLALASGVTALVTPLVTVGLTALLAGAFCWQERSSAPIRAVLRPLAALTVAVSAGKAVLHRPKPPGSHLHHLLGYYPSGHTPPRRWSAPDCSCDSPGRATRTGDPATLRRLRPGPSPWQGRWSSTATTGSPTCSPGCCSGP